jgi:hypothetical protein
MILSLPTNSKDINYSYSLGELTFMAQSYTKLKSFLGILYSQFIKDKEVESVLKGESILDPIHEHRESIITRAKLSCNNNVKDVAKIIASTKTKNYAEVLHKEIEHAIMGYETKLKEILSDWETNDFEELSMILYGQTSTGDSYEKQKKKQGEDS